MKKIVKKLAKKTLGDVYNKVVLPKHYGVAVTANLKRGFPAKNLKVIGITGTNGKTSTAFLLHAILRQAGYNTGLMTTVAGGLNEDLRPSVFHMTTQPIEVTLNRISEMKKQGIDWLVLEVTSQALTQFRVLGIPIDIAVMTNVTHEHLDYHKTFEKYVQAKLRLFKMADRNKKGRRLGIINGDDENAAIFADEITNVIAYSMQPNPDKTIAHPANLKLKPTNSHYTLKIKDDSYDIVCNLPGVFNVENSIMAGLCARAIGVSKQDIEAGVKSLKEIEGRMTSIEMGQDFPVIVDFAHTPDSFEKLFKNFRPLIKGRIIVMFGSPGQRDKIKGAIQGKIAGKYADILVITEEDDRDEDGLAIMQQIAKGAAKEGKSVGKDLILVHNREKAIEKAVGLAENKNDIVLLLGKGHERYIYRKDGEHPWDEIGATKKALKKILGRKKLQAGKSSRQKSTGKSE